MTSDVYTQHVLAIEKPLELRPQAMTGAQATLLTGESAVEVLGRSYADPETQSRVKGRTPLSLDRDRILYSDRFRRQDDKYHVLLFGNTTRARNYTSHAVKAAHLARVIATRLRLNPDLAEAIALGSKIGAVPFIHVGKDRVPDWIIKQFTRGEPVPQKFGNEPSGIPTWIAKIKNPDSRVAVREYFPWAFSDLDSSPYTSGMFSYWHLAMNPFLKKPRSDGQGSLYTAQLLYGIWHHSLKDVSDEFSHEVKFGETSYGISNSHATYEAMVARYCDDIAWVIENLAEASRVDLLDERSPVLATLGADAHSWTPTAYAALTAKDSGALYSFFIHDLVNTSEPRLDRLGDDRTRRESRIRETITLSDGGQEVLRYTKDFLGRQVFGHRLIEARNSALEALISTALDILAKADAYDGSPLRRAVHRIAVLEGWGTDEQEQQVALLAKSKEFRVQASVAVLATMSDRDVFELVGLR
ncbi:hypothetical protein [Pseudolysinimonas sp.]|uniref:hypothetical protein n=1 Tax=Pseudolysinimonas sp. TaxID=2680009 RepID=UPI0037837767